MATIFSSWRCHSPSSPSLTANSRKGCREASCSHVSHLLFGSIRPPRCLVSSPNITSFQPDPLLHSPSSTSTLQPSPLSCCHRPLQQSSSNIVPIMHPLLPITGATAFLLIYPKLLLLTIILPSLPCPPPLPLQLSGVGCDMSERERNIGSCYIKFWVVR